MKMSTVAIALFALFLLNGCGSTSYRYYKPGASQQQHYKDNYECEKEATKTSGSRANYGAYGSAASASYSSGTTYVDWDMKISCLRARGYQITFE